jgi:hypothetical protein
VLYLLVETIRNSRQKVKAFVKCDKRTHDDLVIAPFCFVQIPQAAIIRYSVCATHLAMPLVDRDARNIYWPLCDSIFAQKNRKRGIAIAKAMRSCDDHNADKAATKQV